MADWLRLPSGLALNMERFARVRSVGDDEVKLGTADGYTLTVNGADAHAVQRYLEDRTYGGERAPRQRWPDG